MATNPLEKYLANGLADFDGLRISGTLPVKQEVLNELLQTVLKDMQEPSAPSPAKADAAPAIVTADKGSFDPRSLLKFLKKAELRAETGRIVLDFDVSVDTATAER